ncbi:MAG TPA: site-2 protease family protein [Acidimicrobiales bacterium]|jgi:Zn-dependent protease
MWIAVAVAVVVMAELVRSGRINSNQLIYFVVLIPSIILHEISHGVVALAFGDDTAKRAGRLNLNPIRHIDPIGTLLVPALLSLSGIGAYGWAKPVPVNANRLRSPRNHVVIVSLVGPLTNFALAALCGVVFANTLPATGAVPLYSKFLFYGGIANIVLGVFNLIPCPPLDGAAVLERLLPARLLPNYYQLQPFLMFLPFILILLFRNQWSELINHVINWWYGLVT